MNSEATFFIAESVRLARSMSYPDMMKFMRGMSYSLDETPEAKSFLDVYRRLNACEEQLDLIASGQIKLELNTTTKGHRK